MFYEESLWQIMMDYFTCWGTEELILVQKDLSDYTPVLFLSNIFEFYH